MTLPAWMGSKPVKKRQNARSATQERRHAERVGGRVQSGSGSSWRAKGDVKSADHLDELKQTEGKSFSITTTIINKILKAAAQNGRDPRLIIDFDQIGVRAVVTFEDIP